MYQTNEGLQSHHHGEKDDHVGRPKQQRKRNEDEKTAVVTGFHDDTTEQEVQDMLREIITTIEMPIDQIHIKCPHMRSCNSKTMTKDQQTY